jgi:hypothetical protein
MVSRERMILLRVNQSQKPLKLKRKIKKNYLLKRNKEEEDEALSNGYQPQGIFVLLIDHFVEESVSEQREASNEDLERYMEPIYNLQTNRSNNENSYGNENTFRKGSYLKPDVIKIVTKSSPPTPGTRNNLILDIELKNKLLK